MSPKDLIKTMLITAPDMYSNASDLLNYILCGDNVDFHWVNGELEHKRITEIPDKQEYLDKLKTSFEDAIKLAPNDKAYQNLQEFLYKKRCNIIENVETLSEAPITANEIPEFSEFYISEISVLVDLPDYVTPEWAKMLKDFYYHIMMVLYDKYDEESKYYIEDIGIKINLLLYSSAK